MYLETARWVPNSLDSDRPPSSAASDMGSTLFVQASLSEFSEKKNDYS